MTKIKKENLKYYLSPSSFWFEFCIKRHGFYTAIGDNTAALFYWSIRYLKDEDNVNEVNPCTDEGLEELGNYWEYKLDILNK